MQRVPLFFRLLYSQDGSIEPTKAVLLPGKGKAVVTGQILNTKTLSYCNNLKHAFASRKPIVSTYQVWMEAAGTAYLMVHMKDIFLLSINFRLY